MCIKENWQSYQVSPAVPLPKKCYCHRSSETREHVDAFRRRSRFSIPIPFAPLDASIQFGDFDAVFQRRIPLTSVLYITVSGVSHFEATKAPQSKRFQRFHHSHYGSAISPFPFDGSCKGGANRSKRRPRSWSQDSSRTPSDRCQEGAELTSKSIMLGEMSGVGKSY